MLVFTDNISLLYHFASTGDRNGDGWADWMTLIEHCRHYFPSALVSVPVDCGLLQCPAAAQLIREQERVWRN